MAPEEKDPANNPAEEPMFDFGVPAPEGGHEAGGQEMLFDFGGPSTPMGDAPVEAGFSPEGFSPDLPAAAGLGGIPTEEAPADAGEEAADPKGKKKGKKGKKEKAAKVKKEKVQRVKKEKPKKPKKVGPPQFNAYTSMICASLVALVVATGMMIASLAQYDFKYTVPNEYKSGAKVQPKR